MKVRPGWAQGREEPGEQAELMCRRRESENLNSVCSWQGACSWVLGKHFVGYALLPYSMPFYSVLDHGAILSFQRINF